MTQTDANNHTTRFEYDKLGHWIQRKLPGNQSELFLFDAVGNMTKHTNFDGKITQMDYDVLNSLLRKIPDSSLGQPTISFTYIPTGERAILTDASTEAGAHTQYNYNQWHRLETKVISNAGRAGGTDELRYEYDLSGNVTRIYSIHTQGGAGYTDLKYQWDALSRLTNVVDQKLAAPDETSYSYDDVGNLAQTSYPNGVKTSYDYNFLNQLRRTRILNSSGLLANFDYDEAGQNTIPNSSSFNWESGRRLSSSGRRNRAAELVGGVSRTVDYYYDSLNRLTQEGIGSSARIRYDGLTPAGGSGQSLLPYDAVGNRRSRRSTVTGVPSTPSSASFDLNDWLDNDTNPNTPSTRFDANSNTTVADLNGDGTIDQAEAGWTHAYDFENRLISATDGGKIISIVYDGDGNRVRKSVTTGGSTTITYYLVDDRNPTGYAQVL